MPSSGSHPSPHAQGEIRCDLILKGGEVVDPGQGIGGVLDVGIGDGRVVAVAKDLSSLQADRVLDARGKYVTPGLVDLHTHVYAGVSAFGIDADDLCARTGVTTAIDAGSAGWVSFPGLKRYVIDHSQTRILAFVHLSGIGLIFRDGELRNEAYIQPQEAARVVLEHPATAMGIKVRLHEGVGGDSYLGDLLRKAVDAAEQCHRPLMLHTSGSDVPLPDLLPILRPGDILTHCFNGHRHCILNDEGHIWPEVWSARRRGVLFDVGHGLGSFSFRVARDALRQGFPPDTISSDIHAFNIWGPVYDLPTTLSKFLSLGVSLREVILRATHAPAQAIGRAGTLGSLQIGSPADVAIWKLEQGDFQFQDSCRTTLQGSQRLVCRASLRAGRLWYNGLDEERA